MTRTKNNRASFVALTKRSCAKAAGIVTAAVALVPSRGAALAAITVACAAWLRSIDMTL